ncbi:butyrophilin subfamily 1 member A1-like isoform X1 [Ctenopharyngodon idella]|uniref:butyrophilin subfamily 1 member A1-like isoform X1 n=1 Tax=Ctenopharyngodon idella TaxID=7959 RepID=UPI002231B187|nr:butyrophilin subfamily 1 member A1-like isoform X1 [Ctenopharyngodon idella]XP_051743766.1 butyrophilin subfamily 1 member A1-like isoform X1 [Ctenopharyngodon idella]XP_051743767.1 butyrophilin subfamily 1 member A1-like isoform X1 [Ctenopharyngodon idella]XP_051743768.1 butyrophilin subfamily 1 member A1-like isoform X1 [Ctenopharyngodon idella]XP_051743770.1 butyrophilin subfamily 1 member A1-like isoform X1 [Ctenopharyngodon idella]
MKFICLTLLLVSGITDSRSEQYEVVGPADPVFAVAGEDVILPCSVKPNISVVDIRVEWLRPDLEDSLVHLYVDHEDRNTDQIQSYRGRTKLYYQELQRGIASLKLSSIRISDEGRYKCFIQTKSWYDDATVNVRVEAVGSPPVITVDGFDRSGGLHLLCESEGWYPEPDLEWLDSEGVSLSSGTTETHRNTDRFGVKNTVIVYHSGKIHCRVKLKHHMLETLIDTSNNRFISWRTSVILSSVFVVLSVIAGLLIAVFVHKYREHIQLRNEKNRTENEKNRLQDEKNRILNEKNRIENEKNNIENEKNRIQHERDQLLQSLKTIITQALTHLRRYREHDQLLQSLKTIITQALTHLRRHRVNVILDADSAHPRLVVSHDGKQVRDGNRELKLVDEETNKFDEYLGVLGKDGFSSGSFYFEVQVKDQTKWDVGVARESVNRTGWMISLSPDDGYWTVGLRYGKYWTRNSPYVSLSLTVKPQRVGVFVVYEKGLIYFYDVESMTHIYSFTGQSFTGKLYPFVCLGIHSNKNSTPLIICD